MNSPRLHLKKMEELISAIGREDSAARRHVAAALGFDVDNRHDSSGHRSFAYGDLGSLESQLKSILPGETWNA